MTACVLCFSSLGHFSAFSIPCPWGLHVLSFATQQVTFDCARVVLQQLGPFRCLLVRIPLRIAGSIFSTQVVIVDCTRMML